jgi:hypothetical protein
VPYLDTYNKLPDDVAGEPLNCLEPLSCGSEPGPEDIPGRVDAVKIEQAFQLLDE